MSYDETDWRPPSDSFYARRELVAQIQGIEQQLGDALKREAMGWSRREYNTWRKGATRALASRLQALRRLNDWIDVDA